MKKYIILFFIGVIFIISGCSAPEMPAEVTGIIKTTSYGTPIAMKSVNATLYSDDFEQSLDVEFTNEEQDSATFTTEIKEKGSYDLRVYVTPAYSTSTHRAKFENAFVIENGEEQYQNFTLKINQ